MMTQGCAAAAPAPTCAAGEIAAAFDRIGAADVWRLPPAGWFILQTNYDHWETPPASDDRRTPGEKHMAALGQAGVGVKGLTGVMTEWPTFNHHTDYTAIVSANTHDTACAPHEQRQPSGLIQRQDDGDVGSVTDVVRVAAEGAPLLRGQPMRGCLHAAAYGASAG